MEKNAELYARKLEDAYNDIDVSHLRKMQRKMFLCAADCCENSTASHTDIQNCVDKCARPLNNAQTYIKNEIQDFQNRVQRCLMVCNDKIKDKMELEKNSTFSDHYKEQYEECSISCLSRFSDSLPALMFKIRSTLEEHKV